MQMSSISEAGDRMMGVSIVSQESFCDMISELLSHEGFTLRLKPGQHLIDDLGADSLVVLEYGMALQGLGFKVDLRSFDPALLNTDVAYRRWIELRVAAGGAATGQAAATPG